MSKTVLPAIGVIVGRFQAHKLHEAHVELIEYVMSRHNKVVLFLGQPRTIGTRKNPLDFTTRKLMINEKFPGLNILPITDEKYDDVWSRKLDNQIREVFPIGSVMLYGSRDSFIPYYHGQFPTEELVPTSYVSATELREECGRAVKVSADFRAGVIYASQNRYPTAYPTVDVAVLRRTEGVGYEVLIARKPNEEGWRFIGGFVDPSDSSLEAAARREVLEESGANVEGFRYIGSHKIDDWRYHGEVDGIMTTFLAATFTFGIVEPKDDICELKWVPVFTGAGSDQAFGGIQFEPIHARLSTELFRFIGEQTRKELKAPCK